MSCTKNVLQTCKMKQRQHTTYKAQGLFHAKALNHTSRICLVETKKKGRATNWTTAGHLTQSQSSCELTITSDVASTKTLPHGDNGS